MNVQECCWLATIHWKLEDEHDLYKHGVNVTNHLDLIWPAYRSGWQPLPHCPLEPCWVRARSLIPRSRGCLGGEPNQLTAIEPWDWWRISWPLHPLPQELCGRTETHTDTLTLIGTRAPALTLGQRVFFYYFSLWFSIECSLRYHFEITSGHKKPNLKPLLPVLLRVFKKKKGKKKKDFCYWSSY